MTLSCSSWNFLGSSEPVLSSWFPLPRLEITSGHLLTIAKDKWGTHVLCSVSFRWCSIWQIWYCHWAFKHERTWFGCSVVLCSQSSCLYHLEALQSLLSLEPTWATYRTNLKQRVKSLSLVQVLTRTRRGRPGLHKWWAETSAACFEGRDLVLVVS